MSTAMAQHLSIGNSDNMHFHTVFTKPWPPGPGSPLWGNKKEAAELGRMVATFAAHLNDYAAVRLMGPKESLEYGDQSGSELGAPYSGILSAQTIKDMKG